MNKSHLTVLMLLIFLSAAQAQPLNESANRLALEIEWVRSPRAILNVNAAYQEPAATINNTPYAQPVEIEPNISEAQKEPLVWSLEPSDKKLSSALAKWAQKAGWQLVWEADRDFVIESNLHLSGDFLYAVGTVMHSLSDTDYPLQAKINSSTLTLRISRYQDANNR